MDRICFLLAVSMFRRASSSFSLYSFVLADNFVCCEGDIEGEVDIKVDVDINLVFVLYLDSVKHSFGWKKYRVSIRKRYRALL